jgi:hypothetical protein
VYLRVIVRPSPEIDGIDIKKINNVQVVQKGFFPSETSHFEDSVEIAVVFKVTDHPNQAQRQFLDNLVKKGVIEKYQFYDNGDKLLWEFPIR